MQLWLRVFWSKYSILLSTRSRCQKADGWKYNKQSTFCTCTYTQTQIYLNFIVNIKIKINKPAIRSIITLPN